MSVDDALELRLSSLANPPRCQFIMLLSYSGGYLCAVGAFSKQHVETLPAGRQGFQPLRKERDQRENELAGCEYSQSKMAFYV